MAALRLEEPVKAPAPPAVIAAVPRNEAPQVAPPALPVPVSVVVPSPGRTTPKRVVKSKPPTQAAAAPAPVQLQAAPVVKCSRLDDPKIDWLLQQVAKSRSEHPEIAVGASRIEQALLGARGKNLCASDAQALIAQLCTDPEVVKALNQMVAGLPFFIRPSVGDPCKANLVDVMNKMGAFAPGLSSEPS
jgi:hypothetical protein